MNSANFIIIITLIEYFSWQHFVEIYTHFSYFFGFSVLADIFSVPFVYQWYLFMSIFGKLVFTPWTFFISEIEELHYLQVNSNLCIYIICADTHYVRNKWFFFSHSLCLYFFGNIHQLPLVGIHFGKTYQKKWNLSENEYSFGVDLNIVVKWYALH